MSPLDVRQTSDPLSVLLASDQRRVDARRNGGRIVTAALEVLAEKGFDASIPEIATRAGVGRATVYRMFPTKAALIGAVVVSQYRPWIARLEAACNHPDPAGTLRDVIGDLFAARATDRVVLDALRRPSTPEAAAATARVVDLLDALLRAAQSEGTLREDVTITDLRVLLGGCTQQLAQSGDSEPASWRRYANLVLDAMRPLPSRPPVRAPGTPDHDS